MRAKGRPAVATPTYGGQAVIEGVMMRGQREMAVAVREPSGSILVHGETLTGFVYRSRLAKLPFFRGILMLGDTMMLGIRTLMFSANVAAAQEAVEITPRMLWGTFAVAISFAILLFFALPVVITGLLDQFLNSAFLSNFVEKVIRLVVLVGYIASVGFLPDVRRVFAYHGAEHKVINAYEDGAPLEADTVSRYSTAHPRCGTSFLLIVVVISFVFFLLLGQPSMEIRIASRIILIPIVAGVAYELIKFGGAHHRNPVVKALLAPGLALQKLTTREPSKDQLEVAIAALKGVLSAEQKTRQAGSAASMAKELPVG
jgi:uncharacterized protein YqhQ